MENRNGLCADFTLHNPIEHSEPAVALAQVDAHQQLHEGVIVKPVGGFRRSRYRDLERTQAWG